MADWTWFIIGGGLSVAITILKMAQTPGHTVAIFQNGHPIQGLLASFVLGAMLYGTILWGVFA